jgi:xylan 1,4-beta-xylosidase
MHLVRQGIKRELLLHRAAVEPGPVRLRAALDHGALQFAWRSDEGEGWQELGPVLDATYMADEPTRGFTGTMVGLTCVDAYRRDLVARFDHFHLRHGSSAADDEDLT